MSGVEMAECLCDITPVGAGDKRCKKSVDRTLKHLDHCIQYAQENPVNMTLKLALNNTNNTTTQYRTQNHLFLAYNVFMMLLIECADSQAPCNAITFLSQKHL